MQRKSRMSALFIPKSIIAIDASALKRIVREGNMLVYKECNKIYVNINELKDFNVISSFPNAILCIDNVFGLNPDFDRKIDLKNAPFTLRELFFFRRIYSIDLKFRNIPRDMLFLLGSVHSLDLSYTDIDDVSFFGHVHLLILRSCKNIKDVSALSNVHTLDLSYTNISDVTPLKKVHTLNIAGCSNIRDISSLSNVNTLIVSNCEKFIDVTPLCEIKNVIITDE